MRPQQLGFVAEAGEWAARRLEFSAENHGRPIMGTRVGHPARLSPICSRAGGTAGILLLIFRESRAVYAPAFRKHFPVFVQLPIHLNNSLALVEIERE
jgi:hypothetical protein